MSRLVLLLTSPRVAPGLLSRGAWDAVSAAVAVLGRDAADPTCVAIADAGVLVQPVGALEPRSVARLLLDRVAEAGAAALPDGSAGGALPEVGEPAGAVVWVGSDDGDPGLTDALAAEVGRRAAAPEVEVLVGSYDVPGARLLDLVTVMDRLRSPGGCPWDAEQTHASLVPYLIEEAYEAVEAMEEVDGADRAHLVEELGDVLLQVAFHARIGQEDPDDPFDIDDVAAGIVAKLVRRHPHVFDETAAAAAAASTVSDLEAGWERIKAAEKPERRSPLDGIPAGLPALARADKVLGRLERAGRAELVGEVLAQRPGPGAELLALVHAIRAAGGNAEAELRAVLRAVEAAASQ